MPLQSATPIRKEVLHKMMNFARKMGQGMVEYALILVLVAIAAIAVMTILGSTISKVFSNIVGAL